LIASDGAKIGIANTKAPALKPGLLFWMNCLSATENSEGCAQAKAAHAEVPLKLRQIKSFVRPQPPLWRRWLRYQGRADIDWTRAPEDR
jgi:hypothetical protein